MAWKVYASLGWICALYRSGVLFGYARWLWLVLLMNRLVWLHTKAAHCPMQASLHVCQIDTGCYNKRWRTAWGPKYSRLTFSNFPRKYIARLPGMKERHL
jgi:hypothetical protein